MTQHVYNNLAIAINLFSGIFMLYGVYYFVIALFGIKKPVVAPTKDAKTRFAIVIAARDEAAVIPYLLDSLHKQNYPQELVDIYVAPNNCTDNTKEVAIENGALIFEPVGKINVKGQVLTQIMDFLMGKKKYDAVCFFDADNLVHPDYLQKMNDAYQNGAQVAQGWRACKNANENYMTACYAMYYWITNKFYNQAREQVNLSSLVVGSGYMVSISLMEKMGGWHTYTMTEDYEFTAQCVLREVQVHSVTSAIIYDELPLSFVQSWKQRRRWCTGFVQGMEIYLTSLFATTFKKKNKMAGDLMLAYASPALQMVTFITGAASTLFNIYGVIRFNRLLFPKLAALTGIAIVGLYLLMCLFAVFIISQNKSFEMKKMVKGIFFFPIYLFSWFPIGIISLFKKQATWDVIKHTDSVGLEELTSKSL